MPRRSRSNSTLIKSCAIQRGRVFADAAKNGYLVAFAHMYFPGVGHVRKMETTIVGFRCLHE